MANWRKKRNKIQIQDSIGKTKGLVYKEMYYIFKCLKCSKKLKIRKSHIPYSTGCCKKHAQQKKPFEATFGSLKRKSKERGIIFNLTYTQFLEFTRSKTCHYCGDKLEWDAYNEHGKTNPRTNLDRIDNDGPYSKDNCVSCCPTCNYMKTSTNYTEFMKHCYKIIYNQGFKK